MHAACHIVLRRKVIASLVEFWWRILISQVLTWYAVVRPVAERLSRWQTSDANESEAQSYNWKTDWNR